MLKVAIITFHRAINFGAALQTYALLTYLRGFGYDVEVLDYRSRAIEDSYKIKWALNAYFLKRAFLAPMLLKKRGKFYRFIDERIPHTRSLSTYDELKQAARKYDFIITGSDQVWNSQWTNGDDAYLLDFCEDEQKISYAASIGKSDVTEEEKARLCRYLSHFKKLSVREKTGKAILERLIPNETTVNCDPVALLTRDEWEKAAVPPKEKNYVLIYMLVNSETLMNAAIAYAQTAGKRVLLINDNLRRRFSAIYKRFLSPEEFLGLFRNADCIFTNSFHGTMFSIIFEKEVHVELQKYKDAPNSRFTDLLETLGMEGVIFDETTSPKTATTPNYAFVKEKIRLMQEETRRYFESAFERGEGRGSRKE